jgi:MBOAT, membrane-bound O-acyltransferase family
MNQQQNMTGNSRAWNKMTQQWLERYVYARTNNSLTATYFVSAFWHGFYPGYYLFFMSLPIVQQSARAGRKNITPFFSKNKSDPLDTYRVYTVLCIVLNSLAINYMVIPFQMLSWERSKAVWGSYYYGVHAAVIAVYGLGTYVLRPPRADKKTA